MNAHDQAVMFGTGKDDWETPQALFDELNAEFRFDVDVAASTANAKCGLWIEHGAEVADWSFGNPRFTCWCNPPYSRGLQPKFIAKAAAEARRGVTTVMLLPARTDTRAFHAHIWDLEHHRPRPWVREVRFLKGRLKFVGAKDAAPFPSMIVVFECGLRPPEPCGAPDGERTR